MNIFKRIEAFFRQVNANVENRRKNRRMFNDLQRVAVVHETLNKFRSAGLLYVDYKHKNVTIAQSLAEYFIYSEAEWQNFLKQLHQWAVFQFSVNEYTRLFREVQANAEHEAYKANPDIDESGRRLARLKAVSKFDHEHGGKIMTDIPDMQFYVIGIEGGEPLLVSRLINGKYETATIGDE